MQANVNLLLAKAAEIVALKKVTARPFRESDDYPALLIYDRSAERLESETTNFRHYHGPWTYGIQIYESLNTNDNRDTNYDDFSSLETVTDAFIKKATEAGFELTRLTYFPAIIAGKNLAIADLELTHYGAKRYV